MKIVVVLCCVLAFSGSNAFGDSFAGEKAAWEHYYKGGRLYSQADKAEDSHMLYVQALEELKTADSLLPGNFNFKLYLGKVYEALGRYPEAIEQYEAVYEMAGKFENKELEQSVQVLATNGITSCREKSGDRKGAKAAMQRDLQGKPEGERASGYAKLADYALQTGNLADSKSYILKIGGAGPVELGLKQNWVWKCKSKFPEADCQLDLPKATVRSPKAEAVSVYLRNAVHGPDGLEFLALSAEALPDINQAILDCFNAGSYERPKCVPEVLQRLDKDIGATGDAGLKEWKRFLSGMIRYETGQFTEAQEAFAAVSASGADKRLCAAALHLQADIAGILRKPEKELSLLDELQARYPGYDKYPQELRSYPYCFARERRSCLEMPAVSEIAARRGLIGNMAAVQKDLSFPAEASSPVVISSRTALARLYDAYCPAIWVYGKVCPDALELYKELHELAPNSPSGDEVFLKIQNSKFCYEYEGDEIARSQDIVANYGPFLEKYPQSPLVPDILLEYDKAKAFLDNLPEPPKEQLGCSSYKQ